MAGKGPTFQGEISPDGSVSVPESTASTLRDHGVEVGKERETKIEQEQASTFGVDDRSTRDETPETEQAGLFPDQPETQETLAGETATDRFLFEEQ